MRYRVTEYEIEEQTIVIPEQITIEDLRLIVNETQQKVICSSMQKNNVYIEGTTIIVPPNVCIMQPGDQLTIEIDKGDSLSSVAKQGENQEATNTAIMLSLDTIKELIGEVTLIPNNDDVGEGNQAWTLVLDKTMSVNNGAIE